jgi:hypothetical protein
MIRPRLEFGNDPEIRAKEAASELGDQLFARAFASILAVTAEIAIDAMSGCGPVNGLVRPDGDIRLGVAKTLDGRHLDMIGRGGVERAGAAVPNDGAGVGEESVSMRVALNRRWDGNRPTVIVLRQAIDLIDAEDGIGFKERDIALDLIAIAIHLGVCTENPIGVDDAPESPKLAE